MEPREYLKPLLRTREEVEAFISKEFKADPRANNNGWTYCPDLGWVLKDAVRHDGINRSKTFYAYEPGGARRQINAAGLPCRIHTYGDSFTHCDQVSDGETWQEYLAAHLREPVANYGVGGYGVYQAYMRMRKVEAADPAEFIVFNIFNDDHYRNLDAWRSIRFGTKTFCGYTLPHLHVDLTAGTCEPRPNLCGRSEDLFGLTDLDWVARAFADDPVLKVVLATRGAKPSPAAAQVPVSFGLPQAGEADDAVAAACDAHARAALLASCRIVDWLEQFAAETGKKVLIVLSHGSKIIRQELEGRPRWDQSFLDHLAGKAMPALDLRDAHKADFARRSVSVEDYVKEFYVGHYSPKGNFFEAWAMMDAVAAMLDPKPLPYRP